MTQRKFDPALRRADLSQHFLRSGRITRRFVAELPLQPGELVVEAGAGIGAITAALAAHGCRVIAVEKDVRLFRPLRARFLGRTNVECRHADYLTLRPPGALHKVVSSVPYSITSAVVRKVIADGAADAFLIVQREAAEKFAGTPRETLFSLLHKPWLDIRVGRSFRRRDFVPPPSVDSVLLSLHRREQPHVEPASRAAYRRFVRGTFGARGPDARASLRQWFTSRQIRRLGTDLGFAPDARPSQLTFEQWLAIFRFYEHVCLGRDPCVAIYRNMSRSGARISSCTVASAASNCTPRTIATGTRASLPCTSSAAAASSSTTAMRVTRSS